MTVVEFGVEELASLGIRSRGHGCDFDAEGVPCWRYPARDIGLGAIVYGATVMRPVSVGGWRACQDCADLIEAGDWPALARRCLRSARLDLSRAGPGMRVRLLAQIASAHRAFQAARNGPRERLQ